MGLDQGRLAAAGHGIALASPHPLATAAGMAVAEQGGNAAWPPPRPWRSSTPTR